MSASDPLNLKRNLLFLFERGQFTSVVEQATKLSKKNPHDPHLWNLLGAAYAKLGDHESAKVAFQRVIGLSPLHIDANFNLAKVLTLINQKSDAIKVYKKVLKIDPKHFKSSYNLAILLREEGDTSKALSALYKTIKIKPDLAEAYNSLGSLLAELKQSVKSVNAFQRAISLKPNYAEALYNLGQAFQDQGNFTEAIEAYNKSLTIKPDYAEAHNNKGIALQEQGKLKEAMEAYNKSLAIKPDYADAHQNMGFALLAVKDFDLGFKKSEWRWKTGSRVNQFLKSSKPLWNGEKGQRVLVWNEQGIGDEIMFSSIIPEIYATSLKILVKCDKRLIPLFERSFQADVTYYSEEAHVSEDEYDFHIPMGSLPLTFRTSLDSFKKSALGFLKCDTARTEDIKGHLTHKQNKKFVGISWMTTSGLKNSSFRNIDLADLARALDGPNTQLVCLQYGDVSNEIKAVKKDFGIDIIQFDDVDNKNDIDGLASLISACDQIVSTTNITVHLAGALGEKVTALLPFSPRWIWGDGSESFWYESVTPLKQICPHNWNDILDNLRSNISDRT